MSRRDRDWDSHRHAAVIEDVEFLLRHGESLDRIGARLGLGGEAEVRDLLDREADRVRVAAKRAVTKQTTGR